MSDFIRSRWIRNRAKRHRRFLSTLKVFKIFTECFIIGQSKQLVSFFREYFLVLSAIEIERNNFTYEGFIDRSENCVIFMKHVATKTKLVKLNDSIERLTRFD